MKEFIVAMSKIFSLFIGIRLSPKKQTVVQLRQQTQKLSYGICWTVKTQLTVLGKTISKAILGYNKRCETIS